MTTGWKVEHLCSTDPSWMIYERSVG